MDFESLSSLAPPSTRARLADEDAGIRHTCRVHGTAKGRPASDSERAFYVKFSNDNVYAAVSPGGSAANVRGQDYRNVIGIAKIVNGLVDP